MGDGPKSPEWLHGGQKDAFKGILAVPKVKAIIVRLRNELLALMRVMVRRGGSGSLVEFHNTLSAHCIIRLDNEIGTGDLKNKENHNNYCCAAFGEPSGRTSPGKTTSERGSHFDLPLLDKQHFVCQKEIL